MLSGVGVRCRCIPLVYWEGLGALELYGGYRKAKRKYRWHPFLAALLPEIPPLCGDRLVSWSLTCLTVPMFFWSSATFFCGWRGIVQCVRHPNPKPSKNAVMVISALFLFFTPSPSFGFHVDQFSRAPNCHTKNNESTIDKSTLYPRVR